MKLRKIDLRNYKITIGARSPLLDKILLTPGVDACLKNSGNWSMEELSNLLEQKTIVRDYDVKEAISNILWIMRLPSREAWEKRNPLIDRIKISDGEIFLDKEGYMLLLKAFEQFDRSRSNEQELLKRVFEAEEVEMEEKKETK